MLKERLGKKQTSSHEDWVWTVEHIEELRTLEHTKALVAKTVKEIREKTAGMKVAYGHSGGKDSLALQVVCELAGIEDCVHARSSLFEYPAFMKWFDENKPEKCEVFDAGLTWDWLLSHPDMLFPKDSRFAGQWFRLIQHRGQATYYKKHGLDMILLGRRRQDGNYVGKGTNVYESKGVVRYSPIADWTHEDVLAVIHYFKVPMPPIYDTVNGYVVGTGVWPARQWCKTDEQAWAELYSIDPSIVEEASAYLEGAKAFLAQKD